MPTEALAMYEDVPHALDRADTIYRRLQRVLETGGSTDCSASRFAHAEQLFDAARARAAKTHGRANWDDRRAVERLIDRTELARERVATATHRAAKDLGWKNQDSLQRTLALLAKSRDERRRDQRVRATIEKLKVAYWPLVVIGLAGFATSLLRGVTDSGVDLAIHSLPLTIALGVAILVLVPTGARPRGVVITLAVAVIGFVFALLELF